VRGQKPCPVRDAQPSQVVVGELRHPCPSAEHRQIAIDYRVLSAISFSLVLFSYQLIMYQMKKHTAYRVFPQGAAPRLLWKDLFRVSFYP
jgi:hypothetical protein